MKHITIKKSSLYYELLKLLIIATILSGILFAGINYLSTWCIDSYYDSEYHDRNQEYVSKLQEEIESEKLSVKDTKKLAKWVRRQKVISVHIYKDNMMVFNSEYPNQEVFQDNSEVNLYDYETYYNVTFTDGKAFVTIYGFYAYQMYNYVMILDLLFTFIVFLLIVMLGIRKTIRYIRTIDDEIEILEGGNLDYNITVSGKNELASLAKGLDDMRCSFKEHLETESHLVSLNRKMITEMSHDLRTPLTSIIIYSDLLLKGKFEDEQQMKEYIEKINKKTYHLKQLTDHLFEYSLVVVDKDVKLDTKENAEVVFYDMLSEMCGYLEQNGINTDTDLKLDSREVSVNSEYICRIFDNITSNIFKYADYSNTVNIDLECIPHYIKITIKNSYCENTVKEDSTNIGVENIKNMMKQMNGLCEVEMDKKYYAISLYFKTNN